MITPQTHVEDENSRNALAKNATGLTFAETTPSEIFHRGISETLPQRSFSFLIYDILTRVKRVVKCLRQVIWFFYPATYRAL